MRLAQLRGRTEYLDGRQAIPPDSSGPSLRPVSERRAVAIQVKTFPALAILWPAHEAAVG
jgi:hypothetical protein